MYSEGRFVRQTKRAGYFAHIEMILYASVENTSIAFDCQGRGFYSQGYVEEVTAEGYDDWKRGAIAGIEYALKKCGKSFCITITKIEGLTSDTNATIVGAAAIEAIWKAASFQPSEEEKRRLEQLVLDSWAFPPATLPHFER